MSERYIVSTDAAEHRCCYDAAVVDTAKPVMIGGKQYEKEYERICECHTVEDAKMIAAALNAQDAISSDAVKSK